MQTEILRRINGLTTSPQSVEKTRLFKVCFFMPLGISSQVTDWGVFIYRKEKPAMKETTRELLKCNKQDFKLELEKMHKFYNITFRFLFKAYKSNDKPFHTQLASIEKFINRRQELISSYLTKVRAA